MNLNQIALQVSEIRIGALTSLRTIRHKDTFLKAIESINIQYKEKWTTLDGLYGTEQNLN